MQATDKKLNIGLLFRKSGGGITRFIENILNEFNQNEDFNFFIFTDQCELKNRFKNLNIIFIKNNNRVIWDYIKVCFAVRKYKLDVLYYTKNIIPFTHYFLKFKKVDIVYDLAYFNTELNAYRFLDALYFRCFTKLSCNMADKVIAISENTKKDLQNILNIPENKIKVVYGGIEKNFKNMFSQKEIEETLIKYDIKKPFIFYCGTLNKRKNLLRLFLAFSQIKETFSHNVYIAGDKFFNQNAQVIEKYVEHNLNNRVFFLGHVSEEVLRKLYSSADMFYYASLYEGFGLPILEAQSCGCPVLTSNTTSCSEVAKDGACLVDPYDINAIINGIYKILKDKQYRSEIIKSGYKNIERFSWERSVKEILDYE